MRNILFVMVLFLAMPALAQNTWEIPQQQTESAQKKAIVSPKKQQDGADAKYLAGAVTTDSNGSVVFQAEYDAPGLSAQQIYDRMLDLMTRLTQEPNQIKGSKVAIVNKDSHVIVTTFKEWLVFQRAALSLDQTEFHYTLVITCTDGHVKAEMTRMRYLYEMDREGGFNSPANEVITDEWALNKKKTKLAKYYGKFRKKTIDRKDNLFGQIEAALH